MKTYIRTYFKHIVPLLSVCGLALCACTDWTEQEALEIKTPSIAQQNPELYDTYVKSLNDFKASEHAVVMLTVDNESGTLFSRSQHLVDMPDSADYICLNHIDRVHPTHLAEMTEVRRLGTKVLGLVDFDAIESAWKAILEAEALAAAAGEKPGEAPAEAGEAETPAARFIAYCRAEVAKQIEAVEAAGTDGIVARYTGFDLHILVKEEDIAAETARQAAFFEAVAAWKKAHADRLLFFKGAPQNVMDKTLLEECRYIIVDAHSVKNDYEMSYRLLMASVKGVPTDRFLLGVTTPYATPSGAYNGRLGNGSSAITGAARWAVSSASDYVKAGLCIDAADQDYYSQSGQNYLAIKEAINIMSPTVK